MKYLLITIFLFLPILQANSQEKPLLQFSTTVTNYVVSGRG